MIGFAAYQKYLAIMMHFNVKTNYDYFKYNGKTNAKLESYQNNKSNIYKYAGIEKRIGINQLETFFFVNFEGDYKKFVPQPWYKYYKKVIDSLDNFPVTYAADLKTISDMVRDTQCSRDDLFTGGEFHLHPLLYVWYDKGIISRYTMLFIDSYIESIFDESHSSDPLLWKEVVDAHRLRVGFYRRCYFLNLKSKDEMIKSGQKQLNNL